MYLLRDYVGIGEDARTDNPAHHDHCRVEEPETARERVVIAVRSFRLTHRAITRSAQLNRLLAGFPGSIPG